MRSPDASPGDQIRTPIAGSGFGKPGMIRSTRRLTILSTVLCLFSIDVARGQEPDRRTPATTRSVWPGQEWQTATPESQGLCRGAGDAVAAYAKKSGGGSGCIIRHGYLVKEWGDPKKLADIKSATKGAVGTTLLGLGRRRGPGRGSTTAAVKHYPAIGTESTDNPRDRLAEITIRHLATMTAGFDDGRPPKLVYRPGTDGFYSNDGANMLAELLTLRFDEDLAAVLKREVMDPHRRAARRVEVARECSTAPKTIDGLKSREFASGITITHRALARIGYLYLRGGEWNGRRILSREFIRTATRPTDLPASCPITGSSGAATAGARFREYAGRRLLGARPGR